jgi:hypothetical protein
MQTHFQKEPEKYAMYLEGFSLKLLKIFILKYFRFKFTNFGYIKNSIYLSSILSLV